MTLTLTSNNTVYGFQYAIVSYAGAVVQTPLGYMPIAHCLSTAILTNTAMSGAPSAYSEILAFKMADGGAATNCNPGSSWAKIVDQGQSGWCGFEVECRATGNTSNDASWANNGSGFDRGAVQIAAEIVAAVTTSSALTRSQLTITPDLTISRNNISNTKFYGVNSGNTANFTPASNSLFRWCQCLE